VSTSSTIMTEEHLAKIDKALASLKVAQNEIAMAERAGLTTGAGGEQLSALKAKVEDTKAKLLQLKNVYFPNS